MNASALVLLGLLLPCGGHPPEIVQALELRDRLGVQERSSPYAIYVHSQSAHHSLLEYTRVATRDAGGQWTVISAGEERPGLVGTAAEALPQEQKLLPPAESERVDRLLRDPRLYREASPAPRETWIGGAFHTMEIVTPERRTVLRWTGRLGGRAGQVADLIMGRGEED